MRLDLSYLHASPRDLSALGHVGDPRTLDKVVDGSNITDEDHHMWLAPFTPGTDHLLTIDLGKVHELVGLRVYNYNKNDEGASRGVRNVAIRLDEGAVGGGVHTLDAVLRRAPGHSLYDFGQVVPFLPPASATPGAAPTGHSTSYVSPPVRQDYETPMKPVGMLLKFVLHSSWGDPYYMGLDRLEVVGGDGAPIPLRRDQVAAAPHSLRSLGLDDTRVPENLAEPVKLPPKPTKTTAALAAARAASDTAALAAGSWLTPLTVSLAMDEESEHGQYGAAGRAAHPMAHAYDVPPSGENELYILFDQPTAISTVRLWNYSKTPERGVREVSVWFDELLIHRTGLSMAASHDGGHQTARPDTTTPHADGFGGCQSLVFTNDPAIVRQEKALVAYCGADEQDVLCIDERQVSVRSKWMNQLPDPSSHGVWDSQRSQFNANRPTTGAVRPRG